MRASALKARTAALQQLDDLISTAPQQLRGELRRGQTLRRAELCLKLRADSTRLQEPLQAAKLALRSLARRVRELEREITELERRLERLAQAAVPRTLSLFGVGTHGAPSRGSAAPPRSKQAPDATTHHRLDFGGDRQANRALHMIAVCRLRHCERTRAYATRRAQDGLNRREILRCLKRYIARETYHTLRADLAELAPPRPSPARTVTISSGAGRAGSPAAALDIYRNVPSERLTALLSLTAADRG